MVEQVGAGAEALGKLLREAGERVRVRRGVLALTRGALGGGVVALLLIAAAKTSLVPLWMGWVSPLAVAVGAGLAFLVAWSARPSPEEMAQLIDLRYGLAERVTAGWEIAQRGGARSQMEERTLEAAVQAAARADAKSAVPVRAPQGAPFGLASFLLPVILALVLPAWVPPFLQAKRADTEAVKKAGEELEKAIAAMATPTPTPAASPVASGAVAKATPVPAAKPDKNEPQEKMKALAEKMKKGEVSKRQAMKELSEIEREMAREQSKAARAESARALSRAASEMEGKESTKGLGKALSEGEAEEIRKEQAALAKQFDSGEFEKHEQKSMAEDLEKLADALEQGGDSAAAAELREAAKALRNGDKEAAKQHLEKADLAAAAQGAREADPVADMAKELRKNADTKPAGKAMDQGSPQKTAEQLEKLAERLEKGELGEKGEKELAKTLEDAAKAGKKQGENSPGGQMSKPMETAANSLKSGNRDGAAEALRNLSKGMQRGSQQARKNAQSRDAVAQARARLSGQRGKPQKMRWGQQGEQGEGQQGEGKGEGEGEGEGEGKGEGQGGKGKGGDKQHVADGSKQAGTEAGSGTSKFQDQGFQAGQGPQQDRQSDRASDWRKEYEQAYKAARTNQAKLQDAKITGKMTAGESQYIETEGKPEKGTANEGYLELPDDYRDAAEEAVGNEDIPPEHRDRVKSYFESLSGTKKEPTEK